MVPVMEAVERGISSKKLKNIIIGIFLVFVILFGILFFLNKNIINVFNNNLPFSSTPSFLFSIYGSGMNGVLKKPMGVTVAHNKIYITDTDNNRVQVFDYEGNFILKFGSAGTDNGQFKFPYGIAVDNKGDIYVSDFYNHNIQIFDQNGQYKRNFGIPNKDFSGPAGIAIDGNRLYLTDINESKIMIFDMSGKKLKEFGKSGKGKGELGAPNFLTINNNQIYVSEASNRRVQVFDQSGKSLYIFDERDPKDKAKKTSYLVNPRGIGIDGKGQVYVASKITSKIFIFNIKGKYQSSFGSMGIEDEQFNLPNGLFVDGQGRIYITDYGNERVNVYQN